MGSYNLLTLLASIISAIVGVAFVVVGIKTYKGQMNAQIFSDFNQRYDDIAKDFPKEAWEARFKLDTILPPASEELTLCVLRYLNLSSEEFYLYHRKYIRKDVWKMWELEMVRTLRSPLFRREWKTLSAEFVNSYREFFDYVEEVQKQNEIKVAELERQQ